MDRYTAWQYIIRIGTSDATLDLEYCAQEIARVCAVRWGVDGANITYGTGLWKGEFEPSAAIEIIAGERSNEDMQLLRNHITAMGLTAFVTVTQRTTAFELY
jgi:hypothetical protein